MGFLSRLGNLASMAGLAIGRGLAGLAASASSGWSGFWFGPADPLPLGAIRVGTGIVLLWMLLATTPLLPTFYARDGWVDQATADLIRKETPYSPPPEGWEPAPGQPDTRVGPEYRPDLNRRPEAEAYYRRWNIPPGYVRSRGMAQFSPFFHITTPAGMYGFHAVALLVAALFLLGLGGRVTCVLAWAVALCYIHRVQAALFGMDTILALLLLYLAIGPSTARLSLDRRFNLVGEEPGEMANLALRLMQVHFAFIYLASGMSKLQGTTWWNGTALWQTLSNGEFTPRIDLYWEMLRLLSRDRVTWEVFHSIAGSVFTLFLEIGLPFVVWFPRWRPVCVIGAVFLHLGIGLAMGLVSFSVLMMLLVASFIPSEAIRRWLPAPCPNRS